MKKKIYTLTIGIPAYNEEANIGKLIKSLLFQKQHGFILKKIIVVSDCSSDKTDEIVRSFKNKVVKLIRKKVRSGKAGSLNIIKNKSKSEIVIFMDADISIKDKNFLTKLISPIIKDNKAGIVCPMMLPTSAETFFGDVINSSILMKNKMLSEWNNGNNIITCSGASMVFNNELLKRIEIPNTASEDGYLYSLCIKKGFSYRYEKSAVVYFKSPQNINDHRKQRLRYLSGKNDKVKSGYDSAEYKIPVPIFVKNLVHYLVKNPVKGTVYLIINALIRIRPNYKQEVAWQKSLSTKIIKII